MKIGIIGCGNIGFAFAKSLEKNNIIISLKTNEKLKKINLNVKKTTNNIFLTKNSNIIIVAVKPKDVFNVLNEIKDNTKNKIIISIAAGISLNKLEKKYSNLKFVWLMPNILALINKTTGGYILGKNINNREKNKLKQLFSQLGKLIEISNVETHALTVLSGSGPAFISYFINAIIEESINNKLNTKKANELLVNTLEGTALLLKKYSPNKIIKMVASPGGVTEEGLNYLNKNNINKHIKNMIKTSIKKDKKY